MQNSVLIDKTDITGDKDAKTAVMIIFDIFGFVPQIIQGADIIAAGGNHLVYFPLPAMLFFRVITI